VYEQAHDEPDQAHGRPRAHEGSDRTKDSGGVRWQTCEVHLEPPQQGTRDRQQASSHKRGDEETSEGLSHRTSPSP